MLRNVLKLPIRCRPIKAIPSHILGAQTQRWCLPACLPLAGCLQGWFARFPLSEEFQRGCFVTPDDKKYWLAQFKHSGFTHPLD